MTDRDRPDAVEEDLAERVARIEARVDKGNPPASGTVERVMRYLPFVAIGNFALAAPAFLISVAVAYFSFVQAEATEKMQIATVWPHLAYATGNLTDEGEPQISLTVGNQGVGPARVEGMEIRYHGKTYRDAESLLKACCVGPGFEEPYLITSRLNGLVLRAGETTEFIRLDPVHAAPEVYRSFNANRFDVQVKLCYCSVFDECWVMDTQVVESQPVDFCPADWDEYGLPESDTPQR